MQVGDLYHLDYDKWGHSNPALKKHIEECGTGPYEIIEIRLHNDVMVRNITDGRVFGLWGSPAWWGRFDPFLTAAHKASQCK